MTAVLLCADAQASIGTGHVRRMLTLAEVLQKDHNARVSLLTSELGQQVARSKNIPALTIQTGKITPSGVKEFLKSNSFDLAVLDNYHWQATSEAPLRPFVRTICVVDDLANRPHDADILIDQNAHHEPETYDGLVPQTCLRLVGAEYCMLPLAFCSEDIKQHIPPAPDSNAPVFVSLGGGDPTNSLFRLVELVLENTPYEQTVATGSHIPDASKLLDLATANSSRLEVVLDSKIVKGQMLKSRMALAAGGTMTWERAVVGLPSLCLLVADNQLDSSTWLETKNIHQVFDMRQPDWNSDEFLHALHRFTASPRKLNQYRDNSKKLITGDGAFRVAKALIDHVIHNSSV